MKQLLLQVVCRFTGHNYKVNAYNQYNHYGCHRCWSRCVCGRYHLSRKEATYRRRNLEGFKL